MAFSEIVAIVGGVALIVFMVFAFNRGISNKPSGDDHNHQEPFLYDRDGDGHPDS
jgi:hypothetical protein